MDDLLGWQQTRWGMSEAEIIVSVGKEQLKKTPRQKYQGMYSDLMIPSVDVGKIPFDIIFQMEEASNQLSQVLVSNIGDPQLGCAGAVAAARKLLTERFGTPERIGSSDGWQWVFPTTTIEIFALEIEDISADTYVRFFPTKTGRASKQTSAF